MLRSFAMVVSLACSAALLVPASASASTVGSSSDGISSGSVVSAAGERDVVGRWVKVGKRFAGDVRVEVACPSGLRVVSSGMEFRVRGPRLPKPSRVVDLSAGSAVVADAEGKRKWRVPDGLWPSRLVEGRSGETAGGSRAFSVVSVKPGVKSKVRAVASCR